MKDTLITLSDACDITAFLALQATETEHVLNITYTIILICSIVLGIVLKLISALRDKKITKDEAEEIKKEIDDGLKKIDDERKKDK